jgi:hypothetical protein
VESADPTWTCVSGGNTLNFDGVDDQVLAPDYDVLNTISISTWIKWDVLGASEGIISKRTDTEVAGNWALRGDNSTPGLLEWMVWSGLDSSQSLNTSTTITPGVWTHVVLTFNDSTNAANFYINGSSNSSGSITNNLANTPQPIIIGWSGQNVQFFDGSIEDLRIYNRVLAPAEISALAASPPADCATLPTWWDASYGYRARITVSAGSSAIAANYPTRFTFNHAGLVSGGKSLASGNDARLVYWNGSTWTELSRALFDDGPAGQASSTWNAASSTLFFKTVAGISASGSDTGYYLYYGNPLAGSPPNNTPSSRYYLAESLAETQTTSTTYASKVQLQFTPSAATEQWVVVATWRQRRVAVDTTADFYAGRSQIRLNGAARTGNTDMTFRMASGTFKTMVVLFKITGTTVQQTINIDFASYDTSNAGIDNARVVAFLIPDPTNANIQYAESLVQVTDTVNPFNSQTLTFTPASAGDYIWMANGYFHEPPGGATTGGLYVIDETGTEQQRSEESYVTSSTDGFVPLTHFERRSLTTGSQSFIVRHSPDITSGSHRQGLTQILFRADVFEGVEVASDSTSTSTTSTSPVTKISLTTASVASARDYVYLAVMMVDSDAQPADRTISESGRVRLAASTQLEDEAALLRSGYNHQVAWAYAENVTGNRTIDTQYQTESSALAVQAQFAHILALRYKEPGTSLGPEE